MIFQELLQANYLWGTAIFLYFIGIISLVKNRKHLYLLCLPIITHLILSSLHLYPFDKRFILYQLPFIIILISYGSISIYNYLNNHFILKLIICLLLSVYAFKLTQNIPIEKEEIKKSLAYINTHINAKDNIYVYYSSVPAFQFYKNEYLNIKKENTTHFGSFNRADWKNYVEEINRISNDVWLIFSHVYTEWYPNKPPETEEQFIIEQLTNKDYIILSEQKFKGSSCYRIRKK